MNSLNTITQTKSVWDKFKKVNGNYKHRTISTMKKGWLLILTKLWEFSRALHKIISHKKLPKEKTWWLIRVEGVIPKRCKSAIVTPLLNERKDPKDVRSNRPVLCKIFKRITNKRLVFVSGEKEKNSQKIVYF